MQQTIDLLRRALSPLYDEREVKAITRLLLEEVCGLTRTEILLCKDKELSAADKLKLSLFSEKLSQGEPIQQVLGYEWFAGHKFAVDRNVLIPRPETAELVDWMLQEAAAEGAPDSVLDVGTGSGCIALSLAASWPKAAVTALDISEAALCTARGNARSLGIDRVTFCRQDILQMAATDDDLPQDRRWSEAKTPVYDLIVSNPPYIRQCEASDMSHNVLDFEPHSALFVPDEDPLLFYRAIATYGSHHLRPNGRLYFEINAAWSAETCRLLADAGYAQVCLRQDCTGRDRMIGCRAPQF